MITIDTGVTAIGYAVWDDITGGVLKPVEAGVIHADQRTRDFHDKVRSIGENLAYIMDAHSWVRLVVLEYPMFFGASTVRDAMKLAFAAGAITNIAWSKSISVSLVTPTEWKGQLKKDALKRRVRRRIPDMMDQSGREIRSHAIDATGIGLWNRGVF